jgi:hypothetical protein
MNERIGFPFTDRYKEVRSFTQIYEPLLRRGILLVVSLPYATETDAARRSRAWHWRALADR